MKFATIVRKKKIYDAFIYRFTAGREVSVTKYEKLATCNKSKSFRSNMNCSIIRILS